MGKASGVSRRRRKTKNYRKPSKSKAAANKKRRLKKTKVTFPIVRKAYTDNKSLHSNFVEMGLIDNPNTMFKTPKPIDSLVPELNSKNQDEDSEMDEEDERQENSTQMRVVDKLDHLANHPVAKKFKLSKEQMRVAIYMMEKYGEDYEAMARDRKNYYQMSAGQIRKFILKLKKIPYNWNVYLKAKEMATEAAQAQS